MDEESSAGPWIILVLRFGKNVENPTREQLIEALSELYDDEKLSAIPKGIRDEHPSSWLSYGFDDGPEYVVDVYDGGTVIFVKNADQDDAEPLWERKMKGVTKEEVLRLWTLLIAGEVAQLESEDWA